MKSWSRAASDERRFAEILADCLEMADSPQAITACLSRYPADAERLEPLLRSALELRQRMAAPMHEERRLQARQRFLEAAAARQAKAAPRRVPAAGRAPRASMRPLWSSFAPAIVAALLFVVALVPIMGLTSAGALPGDWNYGFKRSAERVRLALAIDPADRLNLQLAFHEQRLSEIERLSADGHLNPSLLRAFANESTALVNTVSTNPSLGPSEALKVEQVTQTQTQVLQKTIEPQAPPAIKPEVAAAVSQSRALQQQAAQVVQAKRADIAASHNSGGTGGATPSGASATPTAAPTTKPESRQIVASPSASASASATASSTAKPTETATASATASPSPTGTAPATPSATATPHQIAISSVFQPPIRVPSQPTPPPPPPTPSLPAHGNASTAAATANEGPLALPSGPAETAPAPSQPISPPASSTRTLLPTTTPTSSPTPTPSPTPLAVPSRPPASAAQNRVLLPAGQQTPLTYNGPETSISQALASIAGQYEAVYYTQPEYSNVVQTYIPGQSDPQTALEPGAKLTIVMKPGVTGVLTFSPPASPTP